MNSEDFADPLMGDNPYAPVVRQRPPATAQPSLIRFLAHLFSVVFHPLFITAYVAAFLIYVHPYVFSGFSEKLKLLRFVSVVLLTAFFPAFAVLLLKLLGFIKSMYLHTQQERIIPYIVSNFFFFWIFYVSRNLPDSPHVYVVLLLGTFLSSVAALMANIYFKVSMHAIAMGSLLTFFVMLGMQGSFSMGIYVSVAILIAGLVCTARLVVSDHYPFEVYAGFLMGIICQAVAVFIA